MAYLGWGIFGAGILLLIYGISASAYQWSALGCLLVAGSRASGLVRFGERWSALTWLGLAVLFWGVYTQITSVQSAGMILAIAGLVAAIGATIIRNAPKR
ncbi:MAG TPA: hypothetical protein VFS50_13295 [Meiothermus sp.]|nr:hypothetical protein [Meiothermus sp.]